VEGCLGAFLFTRFCAREYILPLSSRTFVESQDRNLNRRNDEYGGSTQNRCIFALQVIDAIATVFGYDHVGIKICPTDFYNGSAISHSEMTEVYTYLIGELVARGVGYINISRRGVDLGRNKDKGVPDDVVRSADKVLRPGYEPLSEFGPMVKFQGSETALMVNEEYTVSEAEKLVEDGGIDMVSFGRDFICNPVGLSTPVGWRFA
jgi:2,4-dienoyl-CoA reductase-like NADH-dependent reductase (Old Yellow Enzyme family)